MSPGSAQDPQRRHAPLRDFRLDRHPPKSDSWSASCHVPDMIAPSAVRRKGSFTRRGQTTRRNGRFRDDTGRNKIVSGIIIPPHFRQSPAPLAWEKSTLRWLGSFGFGFLSPQPPGIVGAEPNAENSTRGQRELVLFCLSSPQKSPPSFRDDGSRKRAAPLAPSATAKAGFQGIESVQ